MSYRYPSDVGGVRCHQAKPTLSAPMTSDRPESQVRPRRFLHLGLCHEPNPPIGSFACVLT